jgi:hypothetical protein
LQGIFLCFFISGLISNVSFTRAHFALPDDDFALKVHQPFDL